MRTLLATVTATAVATTLGGASFALAQTGAPTTSAIRVVAHSGVDKTLDLGRKGFSVGDQELSSAKLTKGGQAFGRYDSTCVATFVRKHARELCTLTFALPSGAVTAAGTVSSTRQGPGPFDWAITGGTGAYVGATGFVHVLPANGPKIRMTIHVTS